MLPPARRLAAPAAVLVLLAAAGCSSDSGSDEDAATTNSKALAGLTVTGAFGKEPKVKIEGLDVSKTETGTIIAGDGAEVTDKTALKYRFAALNASNGKELATNFADADPQKLALSDPSPFGKALVGSHIGDRVAVALPVSDLVGKGQTPPTGLTVKDDVVLVFDIIEEVQPPLDGPKGEAVDPPADAPQVLDEDGAVTGLDFADAAATPPKKLQVIPLIQGDGAEVEEDDQLTVNYYGAVYGKSKAFDESYSGGTPAEFALTKGGLIDGWVQGLQGVKVGSRVMLIIPPDQGYGKQGSPPSIPGNSTLVFVIDVLGTNL